MKVFLDTNVLVSAFATRGLSADVVRLLLTEYLKYMVAQVRMRLEPAPDATDVAVARGGLGS